MLCNNGYIKLADFGASIIEGDVEEKYTRFIGTIEYIAPEIVKCQKYNKNIDLWCVGILMFEFLVGHTPFHEIIYNTDNYKFVLEEEIKFPSNLYISEEFKDFFSQCTQID